MNVEGLLADGRNCVLAVRRLIRRLRRRGVVQFPYQRFGLPRRLQYRLPHLAGHQLAQAPEPSVSMRQFLPGDGIDGQQAINSATIESLPPDQPGLAPSVLRQLLPLQLQSHVVEDQHRVGVNFQRLEIATPHPDGTVAARGGHLDESARQRKQAEVRRETVERFPENADVPAGQQQ